MLRNMLGIIRNNWAMEKAGVKTQSLDPKFRLALHKFGIQHGLKPEEVAAFFVRNELGHIANPLEALETIHEWDRAGKLRAEVLFKAKVQYIKQGSEL